MPKRRAVSNMTADLVLSPHRLLNLDEAAAYLGISKQQFAIGTRRGAYDIPSVRLEPNGRNRYRLDDLNQFILRRRQESNVWLDSKKFGVDEDDLPYELIGKLIGVDPIRAKNYMDAHRNRGYNMSTRIKNRKLPAVVVYMRYQWKRELGIEIRQQFRNQIKSLTSLVSHYRKAANRRFCQHCGLGVSTPFPQKKLDPKVRESIKRRYEEAGA